LPSNYRDSCEMEPEPLEAHHGALKAYSGATEAHPGATEAHPGAICRGSPYICTYLRTDLLMYEVEENSCNKAHVIIIYTSDIAHKCRNYET
jgi:hypothetical protein